MAEGRSGADDARTHPGDDDIAPTHDPECGEAAEDRHGLEVTSERVTAGAGHVEQSGVLQPSDKVAPCDRQTSSIGHEISDLGAGLRLLDAGCDRSHLRME